jgi:hypothetical protein
MFTFFKKKNAVCQDDCCKPQKEPSVCHSNSQEVANKAVKDDCCITEKRDFITSKDDCCDDDDYHQLISDHS